MEQLNGTQKIHDGQILLASWATLPMSTGYRAMNYIGTIIDVDLTRVQVCKHKHPTRETALRCGENMLRWYPGTGPAKG